MVGSLADFVSTLFSVIWAWKWIILTTMVSALMINKSLRDRQARLEEAALLQPNTSTQQQPEDWMAEFASKKQPVPRLQNHLKSLPMCLLVCSKQWVVKENPVRSLLTRNWSVLQVQF